MSWKTPFSQGERGTINIVNDIPIHERYRHIYNRRSVGNWEGDLVSGMKNTQIATTALGLSVRAICLRTVLQPRGGPGLCAIRRTHPCRTRFVHCPIVDVHSVHHRDERLSDHRRKGLKRADRFADLTSHGPNAGLHCLRRGKTSQIRETKPGVYEVGLTAGDLTVGSRVGEATLSSKNLTHSFGSDPYSLANIVFPAINPKAYGVPVTANVPVSTLDGESVFITATAGRSLELSGKNP